MWIVEALWAAIHWALARLRRERLGGGRGAAGGRRLEGW